VTGILLAIILLADILFVDESFPPVLLARKADKLRFETKNWALHSKSQEMSHNFKDMTRRYLIVPLQMIIDPISFVINLYAAFVLAIIYLYGLYRSYSLTIPANQSLERFPPLRSSFKK
jgi:hypothetical protein